MQAPDGTKGEKGEKGFVGVMGMKGKKVGPNSMSITMSVCVDPCTCVSVSQVLLLVCVPYSSLFPWDVKFHFHGLHGHHENFHSQNMVTHTCAATCTCMCV